MKLQSATFVLETFIVVFIGARIVVYEKSGHCVIHEQDNAWTSKKPENDGVMGREYKPRLEDAKTILRRVQLKRSRPEGG